MNLMIKQPATYFLLFNMLLLTGCETMFGDDGWFPDRSSDYLQAVEAPALRFPEHSQVLQNEDQYPIPELAFAKVLPKKHQVPRVDALDNIESKGSVRIQNFQGRQWIVVKRSPGQVWPLVLQFLESNQIKLNNKLAEQGTIETGWLSAEVGEEQDAQSLNEKYRFSLVSGVQENTTEVSVLQLAEQKKHAALSLWAALSSDKSRENNMINLLAEHLAGSPEQSSHSLLAQGIGSASKVDLAFDQKGVPYINLQLPFDRAWAALSLALEKANFTVTDLDRSQGVYYAKFNQREKKQKKPGYLKRLFNLIVPAKEKSLEDDLLVISGQQKDNALIITVQGNAEPWLEPNEQAFMLRRIINKLS